MGAYGVCIHTAGGLVFISLFACLYNCIQSEQFIYSLGLHAPSVLRYMYIHMYVAPQPLALVYKWNLSNPDTLGTEESVLLVSEVSSIGGCSVHIIYQQDAD